MKIPFKFYALCNYFLLVTILLLTFTTQAQVGIGTTNPDQSSVLDLKSTLNGLLVPRMTSVQRLAINTPANSLLVFDIDLKSFYFYNTPSMTWVQISSENNKRNNYKLVKSVADLSSELIAGGGNTYKLLSNTYYEINGLINLAFPIDLNDAYISGLDANEDILRRASGKVFEGITGGSIRNLTITGSGTAFNITGGTSLIVQNTIIAGMASVGTISNVGLYFGNIVQFVGNTNGITYNTIGNLLLSNQGWFGDNNGTYETFTGSFNLIEKVSGFSTVKGSAVAIDVSSNPMVGNGVIIATAFSGDTSISSGVIKRYTIGSYPGFNFTNAWTINCPGIPKESDDVASGNIYFNGNLTSGFAQDVPNIINTAFNLNSNTTTAANLFRADSQVNNRFRYLGKKTRSFQINATLAVRGNLSLIHI